MKKTMLTAIALLLSGTAVAQEKLHTTICGDFVNEYIWRGQKLGDVAVQPSLGIEYKNFSLTAWGNYGLTNPDDVKEFDLTIGYAIGGLNLGITDYWFSEGLDPDGRYFKYDAHGTNHVFEANVGYDFGFASLQWYTNFSGNDGLNRDGKRAYSSYFEVSAPFRFGGAEWTATAGTVPFATSSYATSGFAVTNLSVKATKELRVTDSFALPLFAGITVNPCAQKAYYVFGFTLRP